jgi:hypothetical protein
MPQRKTKNLYCFNLDASHSFAFNIELPGYIACLPVQSEVRAELLERLLDGAVQYGGYKHATDIKTFRMLVKIECLNVAACEKAWKKAFKDGQKLVKAFKAHNDKFRFKFGGSK